ncbi:alkaline phosphatase family protein [Gordonia soli]|uniref:Phosphodiesterase n=1 Tax=Gordonia soli NBRC 108243 TaxID=1223545 RepID=M0QIA1_9ACTN|nr:alkaline phosphatase family protein [Gordonia soli]GAC68340.1 hypothetical protein GS4_14_01730 [Gordonia soli NBRC 108243]
MYDPTAEVHPRVWADHPTLADVLPAIGTALGGLAPALPIPTARDVVLLVVDGLGDVLLEQHRESAPSLTALRAGTVRAGFPATTATSITSLMSGTACGSHGIIGYSFRTARDQTAGRERRTLNALRWTLDRSDGTSALDTYEPEAIAPHPGTIADLAARGVEITYAMPSAYRGSGFSRAAFRAVGEHVGAQTPTELRTAIIELLRTHSTAPRFVYAYTPDLDAYGHLFGPGSPQWVEALGVVDRMVADVAAELPSDAVLVVTGDHGMIQADNRIDLDTVGGALTGVEAVAGEMRVRHVYTRPGALDDVHARWTSIVGDHAHLVRREQALDEAWFGGEVTDVIAERVGDLVAVARDTTILTRSLSEPTLEVEMPGHHGAWTAAEQFVPLLVAHSTSRAT